MVLAGWGVGTLCLVGNRATLCIAFGVSVDL